MKNKKPPDPCFWCQQQKPKWKIKFVQDAAKPKIVRKVCSQCLKDIESRFYICWKKKL